VTSLKLTVNVLALFEY